jgi:hypothetical protein
VYKTQQLVERLVICGCPRASAVQIVRQCDYWIERSGTEWTVAHLKEIKQSVLAIRGQNLDKVSPYVRTRNGHLVGPFRQIEALLWKGYKRSLAALMIYSAHVSRSVTKKQEQKWLKAVESPEEDLQHEWDDLTVKAVGLLSRSKIHDFYSHQVPYGESLGWSRNKRAPKVDGSTVPEDDLATQITEYAKTRFSRIARRSLEGLLPEDGFYVQDQVLGNFNISGITGDGPTGKISCIQEPGFKGRWIANPNRVVQYTLQPLGDWLFGITAELPWDCFRTRARRYLL